MDVVIGATPVVVTTILKLQDSKWSLESVYKQQEDMSAWPMQGAYG